MSQATVTFRNGFFFDGATLKEIDSLHFLDDMLSDGAGGDAIDLNGDILSLGYVDLQVNGGGGVMLNEAPSVDTIQRIAEAHRSLGVSSLLPTLITDTPEVTRAVIEAAIEATRANIPGVAGLHLEGPHLSVARKGAHDANLIRPMDDADLHMLLDAAEALPVLKVTVAPENVTEAQVAQLEEAGVLISLGHSDASFDICRKYFAAGARCATHLFNAMSQLGSRDPGLVGAALAEGKASAGLIADGVHVHPETIRAAWAAMAGPGRIFLVSDAMAVAGTDLTEFKLGGRLIKRRDGRLTLADNTLAGADLDLTTAVKVTTQDVGLPLETALQAATTAPANLIGLKPVLRLSEMQRIAANLSGTSPALPA